MEGNKRFTPGYSFGQKCFETLNDILDGVNLIAIIKQICQLCIVWAQVNPEGAGHTHHRTTFETSLKPWNIARRRLAA